MHLSFSLFVNQTIGVYILRCLDQSVLAERRSQIMSFMSKKKYDGSLV